MKIAIASGKGGTGKTTVATNLFCISDDSVLLDCDVEEPNCHLFTGTQMIFTKTVGVSNPIIDPETCIRCGKCSGFCRYNALFNGKDEVIVFNRMCHGCGGCTIICPVDAISEEERRIGEIRSGEQNGSILIDGVLDISFPSGVPIIKEMKKLIPKGSLILIDCPPGTSCSAVESIRGSDICILVTEPTPFGLHDLKAAVEVADSLGIPIGVIINRDGIGNREVAEYLEREKIPLLGTIPNDIEIAKVYSEGKIVINELPKYQDLFEKILKNAKELIGN